MGRIRATPPVKLFCGLLSGDPDLLRRAQQMLTHVYGPSDLVSPVWDFTQTAYYAEEMGLNLKRVFVAFERLIQPTRLADIKAETNDFEQQIIDDVLSPDIARPVNFDPGYLDPGKLVLATTKDRAHRVCIGRGIYAEVTLQFVADNWKPAEWTYPDYQTPHYQAYFTQVRNRLREQRKSLDEVLQRDDPTA